MGRRRLELSGQRFGMLTVLEYAGKDKQDHTIWKCECDCGTFTTVRGTSLKQGTVTSCGCKNLREDLTNQRFGRLIVLEYAGSNNKRESLWLCECDCGEKTIVSKYALKSGHTRSCGCLHKDVVGENSTVHGLWGHPVYHSWDGMHQRCNNKNNARYARYGGRGISVCDEWNEFKNFYDWSIENGYEKGLSIDRIDNDGNYSPENCRWTDDMTQANNKSTNYKITYNGNTHTCKEWSRILDVSYSTLRKRLNRNDMRDFERYFYTEDGE